MSMKGFDFEEERIKQEITKQNAKRVLLQFPEGLKPEAPRLAAIVEKAGALSIISADPCYGACDVAAGEAERLGVDLIVHFGHAQMLKHSQVPTVYIEARATITIDNAVKQAIPLLSKWSKIGLATTVQHIQTLDRVREILVRAGKTVIVGEAGKIYYAGQVTGCDYSNVKSVTNDAEAFLFLGGGRFHALGIALATSKPTVVADPYGNTAYSVDEEAQKILRQRWASISEPAAATMLHLAAYTYGDIVGKSVLDLGCGTGRLALAAAFLGAESVVGVDIDKTAVKAAQENAVNAGLKADVEWIAGDIDAVTGRFDTVLQNPPFGVQTRRADRWFLEKALEAGSAVYSLHNHPY